MSIIERVQALRLPSDEYVVIGAGLLDALGIRETSDIDLVVSKSLYDTLRSAPGYEPTFKVENEECLLNEAHDAEVWLDWGNETYEVLARQAIVIDGIAFANPRAIIAWKRARGTVKDLTDIERLEEYLNER